MKHMRLMAGVMATAITGCSVVPYSSVDPVKPAAPGTRLAVTYEQKDGVFYPATLTPSPSAPAIWINDLTPVSREVGKSCGLDRWSVSAECKHVINTQFEERVVTPGDVAVTAFSSIILFGLPLILGFSSGSTSFDSDRYEATQDASLRPVDRMRVIEAYDTASAACNLDIKQAKAFEKSSTMEPVFEDSTGFNFSEDKVGSMTNGNYKTSLSFMTPACDTSVSIAGRTRTDEIIQNIRRNFGARTTSIETHCFATTSGIKVLCPPQLAYVGRPEHVRPKIVLETVNVSARPEMQLEDKIVSATYDGAFLRIENKSSKYISVEAISGYFDKDVTTDNEAILLPPMTKTKTPIHFVFGKNEFTNVNAEDARHTNISYGIALKYKIQDTTREITLANVGPFNLYAAIKSNRVSVSR